MDEIPQPDRREILRRKIDLLLGEVLGHEDYEGIGRIDGYTIVERMRGFPDCGVYAFPTWDWSSENLGVFLQREYIEVPQGSDGDVVAYYNQEGDEVPRHVGILQGDGRVRSKFGDGYVFDHPFDLVPTKYGIPRFFKKKS